MRIETVPLIIGFFLTIAGLALLADAVIADSAPRLDERRRRGRPERHRGGEAAIGLGILLVGSALIGRDRWLYGTVAILVAVVLLGVGLLLNRKYLQGVMFGPADGPWKQRRVTDAHPVPEQAAAGRRRGWDGRELQQTGRPVSSDASAEIPTSVEPGYAGRDGGRLGRETGGRAGPVSGPPTAGSDDARHASASGRIRIR